VTELTIGLPVYNGATYLAEALDALLEQTWTDFRLLISDNGSSDATPDIIARYAARDARIESVRQTENIGGAGNFAYVLEQAATPFFMWAAHDDRFAPSFAARCLAVLHDDPTALLCTADLAMMHEDGVPTRVLQNLETAGMDRVARAHALLDRFGWYATYGVARTAALKAAMPFTGRYGGDVVQTLQLLLAGVIRCIPEPLILYRVPATFARSAAEQYLAIDHTRPVNQRPYTELATDLIACARQARLAPADEDAVVDTIVRTISFENSRFVRELARENAFSAEADALKTLMFVRSLDVRSHG